MAPAEAYESRLSLDELAGVRRAFEAFDLNHSWSLELGEILTTLKLLGHTATQDEVLRWFRQLDRDGNGRLDFEEFVQLYVELRGTSSCSLPAAIEILSKKPHERTPAELQRLANFLCSTVPWFSHLSQAVLIEVCRVLEVLQFKPGVWLWEQGAELDAMYAVLEGAVSLWTHPQVTRTQTMRRMQTMASFRSMAQRSSSIRAPSPAHLSRMNSRMHTTAADGSHRSMSKHFTSRSDRSMDASDSGDAQVMSKQLTGRVGRAADLQAGADLRPASRFSTRSGQVGRNHDWHSHGGSRRFSAAASSSEDDLDLGSRRSQAVRLSPMGSVEAPGGSPPLSPQHSRTPSALSGQKPAAAHIKWGAGLADKSASAAMLSGETISRTVSGRNRQPLGASSGRRTTADSVHGRAGGASMLRRSVVENMHSKEGGVSMLRRALRHTHSGKDKTGAAVVTPEPLGRAKSIRFQLSKQERDSEDGHHSESAARQPLLQQHSLRFATRSESVLKRVCSTLSNSNVPSAPTHEPSGLSASSSFALKHPRGVKPSISIRIPDSARSSVAGAVPWAQGEGKSEGGVGDGDGAQQQQDEEGEEEWEGELTPAEKRAAALDRWASVSMAVKFFRRAAKLEQTVGIGSPARSTGGNAVQGKWHGQVPRAKPAVVHSFINNGFVSGVSASKHVPLALLAALHDVAAQLQLDWDDQGNDDGAPLISNPREFNTMNALSRRFRQSMRATAHRSQAVDIHGHISTGDTSPPRSPTSPTRPTAGLLRQSLSRRWHAPSMRRQAVAVTPHDSPVFVGFSMTGAWMNEAAVLLPCLGAWHDDPEAKALQAAGCNSVPLGALAASFVTCIRISRSALTEAMTKALGGHALMGRIMGSGTGSTVTMYKAEYLMQVANKGPPDRTSCEDAALAHYLGQVATFTSLPYSLRMSLTKEVIPQTYTRGEIILRQGDPPHALYAIVQGNVGIFKDMDANPSGNRNRLTSERISMWSHNGQAGATTQGVEPVGHVGNDGKHEQMVPLPTLPAGAAAADISAQPSDLSSMRSSLSTAQPAGSVKVESSIRMGRASAAGSLQGSRHSSSPGVPTADVQVPSLSLSDCQSSPRASISPRGSVDGSRPRSRLSQTLIPYPITPAVPSPRSRLSSTAVPDVETAALTEGFNGPAGAPPAVDQQATAPPQLAGNDAEGPQQPQSEVQLQARLSQLSDSCPQQLEDDEPEVLTPAAVSAKSRLLNTFIPELSASTHERRALMASGLVGQAAAVRAKHAAVQAEQGPGAAEYGLLTEQHAQSAQTMAALMLGGTPAVAFGAEDGGDTARLSANQVHDLERDLGALQQVVAAHRVVGEQELASMTEDAAATHVNSATGSVSGASASSSSLSLAVRRREHSVLALQTCHTLQIEMHAYRHCLYEWRQQELARRLAFLQTVPCFNSLRPQALMSVDSSLQWRVSVPRGTVLQQAGAGLQGLLLIRQGTVAVYHPATHTSTHSVRQYHAAAIERQAATDAQWDDVTPSATTPQNTAPRAQPPALLSHLSINSITGPSLPRSISIQTTAAATQGCASPSLHRQSTRTLRSSSINATRMVRSCAHDLGLPATAPPPVLPGDAVFGAHHALKCCALLGPGDFCGEDGLLSGKHQVSIVAETECEIGLLRVSDMTLLAEHGLAALLQHAQQRHQQRSGQVGHGPDYWAHHVLGDEHQHKLAEDNSQGGGKEDAGTAQGWVVPGTALAAVLQAVSKGNTGRAGALTAGTSAVTCKSGHGEAHSSSPATILTSTAPHNTFGIDTSVYLRWFNALQREAAENALRQSWQAGTWTPQQPPQQQTHHQEAGVCLNNTPSDTMVLAQCSPSVPQTQAPVTSPDAVDTVDPGVKGERSSASKQGQQQVMEELKRLVSAGMVAASAAPVVPQQDAVQPVPTTQRAVAMVQSARSNLVLGLRRAPAHLTTSDLPSLAKAVDLSGAVADIDESQCLAGQGDALEPAHDQQALECLGSGGDNHSCQSGINDQTSIDGKVQQQQQQLQEQQPQDVLQEHQVEQTGQQQEQQQGQQLHHCELQQDQQGRQQQAVQQDQRQQDVQDLHVTSPARQHRVHWRPYTATGPIVPYGGPLLHKPSHLWNSTSCLAMITDSFIPGVVAHTSLHLAPEHQHQQVTDHGLTSDVWGDRSTVFRLRGAQDPRQVGKVRARLHKEAFNMLLASAHAEKALRGEGAQLTAHQPAAGLKWAQAHSNMSLLYTQPGEKPPVKGSLNHGLHYSGAALTSSRWALRGQQPRDKAVTTRTHMLEVHNQTAAEMLGLNW